MRAIPVTVNGRRARVLVVGRGGGGGGEGGRGDLPRRRAAWR